MKPNKTFLFAGLLFAGLLLWSSSPAFSVPSRECNVQQSRPYTGKFVMNSGQVVLTLNLKQGADNSVTGTLTSSNGTVFQVKGTFEGNGVATGTCTTQDGGVYFEAYIEGSEMTFSLIEPDANGQPDYDKARYLVFNKAGTGSAAAAPAAAGTAAYGNATQNAGNAQTVNIYQQPQQQQYQQQQHPQQQYQRQPQQQQYGNYQAAAMGQAAAAGAPRAGEVGDDSWGFKFVPPQGWVSQKNAGGIILGHNTIAGMIIVFPHTSTNVQQMQGLMMQGVQEEGSSLTPVGGMRALNNNTLMGDYTGVVNGQQAKARGYGVLSPYGGGAFILAVTTPEKMSDGLTGAAQQIALSMRYIRPGSGASGELVQFFSGVWVNATTNSSSYVYLYPDGTWSDRSESYYSGNFTDGGGNATGNWGAGGAQNGRGRWRVSGNRDQGQIVFISPNGEQDVYEYHVHMENGQKYYSEYYFNGTLYHRKNKYDE